MVDGVDEALQRGMRLEELELYQAGG